MTSNGSLHLRIRSGYSNDHRPIHGVLFVMLLMVAGLLRFAWKWPLFWVLPLGACCVLAATVPVLRRSFTPWRLGEANLPLILLTLAITGISCAALLVYQRLVEPDLTHFRGVLPRAILGSALAAGTMFAIVNAVLEELAFRAVLYDAADAFAGRWFAIVATALFFGYGHRNGYPPGAIGAVLATIYGGALGYLRMRTGGIALPILAHIAADATIFHILLKAGAL